MIPTYFHVVIEDLQPYEYEIERLEDFVMFIVNFVEKNETGHLSIWFKRFTGMQFAYTDKLEANWPELTVTLMADVERTGACTFSKETVISLIGGLGKLALDAPFDTVYLKIQKQDNDIAHWNTGAVNRADLFTITQPEKWN